MNRHVNQISGERITAMRVRDFIPTNVSNVDGTLKCGRGTIARRAFFSPRATRNAPSAPTATPPAATPPPSLLPLQPPPPPLLPLLAPPPPLPKIPTPRPLLKRPRSHQTPPRHLAQRPPAHSPPEMNESLLNLGRRAVNLGSKSREGSK